MSPPLLKGVHIQLSWDQPVAPKRGKVPIWAQVWNQQHLVLNFCQFAKHFALWHHGLSNGSLQQHARWHIFWHITSRGVIWSPSIMKTKLLWEWVWVTITMFARPCWYSNVHLTTSTTENVTGQAMLKVTWRRPNKLKVRQAKSMMWQWRMNATWMRDVYWGFEKSMCTFTIEWRLHSASRPRQWFCHRHRRTGMRKSVMRKSVGTLCFPCSPVQIIRKIYESALQHYLGCEVVRDIVKGTTNLSQTNNDGEILHTYHFWNATLCLAKKLIMTVILPWNVHWRFRGTVGREGFIHNGNDEPTSGLGIFWAQQVCAIFGTVTESHACR